MNDEIWPEPEGSFDVAPCRTLTAVDPLEPIYDKALKRLGLTDTEQKWLASKGWVLFADPTPINQERTFHFRKLSHAVAGFITARRHIHESETKHGVRWEGEAGDTVAHLLDQFHAHRDEPLGFANAPGFSGVRFDGDKLESDFTIHDGGPLDGVTVHTVSTFRDEHLAHCTGHECEEPHLHHDAPVREWGDPETFKYIHEVEARNVATMSHGGAPVDEELTPAMRGFGTGATRSSTEGKLDYEGFLNPLVLEAFATYMDINRTCHDGSRRGSDNWQLGIPSTEYFKSNLRHTVDLWKSVRGYESAEGELAAAGAILFNIAGFILERIKADPEWAKREADKYRAYRKAELEARNK